MSTDIIKLKATADILGGDIFFANENGADPEHLDNTGLVANGMYIRLEGSDGSLAYISAYELNRILEPINDISNKANKSDIELLNELLEEKATDEELELVQSDVNSKASKIELNENITSLNTKIDTAVENLTGILATKAGISTVESINTNLETKAEKTAVDELISKVNSKAESSDVTTIISDINVLKSTVETLTSSTAINNLSKQIEDLTKELEKKLELNDIKDTIDNIDDLTGSNSAIYERLDSVENEVNTKVSKTFVENQLQNINNRLKSLDSSISNKASKLDVSQKANKSDYMKLSKTVVDLNNDINDNIKPNINDLISQKVNKSDYTKLSKSVDDLVSQKADKSDYMKLSKTVTGLNLDTKKLNNTSNTHSDQINTLLTDLENLQCTIKNFISEINNSTNEQIRINTNQNEKLTKIEQNISTNNDKLKQSWVRVVSTPEYKKLLKLPEGYNSPYNPRYKYPNTIYLVVDYNTPKAIYIGDILIAKSQTNGSIGFAYGFPISF